MTSHVKTFGNNLKGRDFFCTDVHGHFDLLHQELNNVSFNSEVDRLFSGGDWCDRGPDSKYILDYLTLPWIHSVRGNHEQMLIDAYENPSCRSRYEMLFCNGGKWFYDVEPNEQHMIYDVFKSLPLGIELESRSGKKVGIVHAECPYGSWNKFKYATGAELEYNVEAVAQWARTKYDKKIDSEIVGVDILLCGHTPTNSGNVEQLGNVFYCDAGSFFRNKLNLIEIL